MDRGKDELFQAPFLPYDKIRNIAEEFLDKYHPDGSLPVPIEEILEFKLKISLILLPGLRDRIEIEGFLSSDFTKIYIDEWAYTNRLFRTRFTIAHEIGHSILHKDLYSMAKFDSAEEWKDFISCIDPREYSFFELHARDFAGLILVPTDKLYEGIDEAIELYKNEGYDPKDLFSNEMAIKYVSTFLSRKFEVSSIVIENRIRKEGLLN